MTDGTRRRSADNLPKPKWWRQPTADILPKPKWWRHPIKLISGRPLIVVAFIFVALFALLIWLLNDEARGLVLGIGIFVGGWIFTAVIDNRSRAEQHTFNLMLNTRFDDNFIKSMRVTSSYLRKVNGEISEDAAKKILGATEKGNDLTVRQAMGSVLNTYEIIAISVYFKDADEFILREYYNGLMLSHYEKLSPIIKEWRKDDPETFVYFEWLAERWSENHEI